MHACAKRVVRAQLHFTQARDNLVQMMPLPYQPGSVTDNAAFV